ncbi:hypothetical protein RYX36_027507 [Vicia faba]
MKKRKDIEEGSLWVLNCTAQGCTVWVKVIFYCVSQMVHLQQVLSQPSARIKHISNIFL